ncbi:MAG: hypothetical protein AAFZ07_19575 [Actinomycetota bacterium]
MACVAWDYRLPDDQAIPDEDLATWAPVAERWLWKLTGRRYGLCYMTAEIELRPVFTLVHPHPALEIRLPPVVNTVEEVRVESVALAAEDWRFVNGCLERTDGARWVATDLGDIEVDYIRGIAPPDDAAPALGELIDQLWRGQTGTKGCRLPERVQSITRQGVQMALLDPFDFLERGLTGLGKVDQFIAADNPHQQTTPPRVFSPSRHMRINLVGRAIPTP